MKEKHGEMSKDGFDYYIEDDLGGVHTDGVGYAPDGRFCGECNKTSCAGCRILKNTGAEFVVPEDQQLRDEDWIRCEDCIYVDDNCVEARRADGCYHGEQEEECEEKENNG